MSTPGDSRDEESLFEAARRIPDAADRRRFLDEACAGRAELRRGLEDLLAAADEADAVFEQPLEALIPAVAGGLLPLGGVASPGASSPLEFGDYDLLAELGRGGMGVVYRARQRGLNRMVALKLVGAVGGLLPEVQRRFELEAAAAAALNHPNIVPIHEFGTHAGQPYYSMKLIEGSSLTRRLGEFRRDHRAAARLLVSVARAVHHAHEHGILHRDLKPGNILLDGDGVPYVSDFGLAKRFNQDTELTASGAVLGTPAYMPPEQASGRGQPLTPAADVYSLGAVLYHLLVGAPPFEADTPLQTLRLVLEAEPRTPAAAGARVERDLETICLKCLEKDPGRRYPEAALLADDLERWLRNEPIRARPSTPAERLMKWARRHPSLAALVVIVPSALVLLLGMSAWFNVRLAAEAERNRQGVVRLNVAAGARLVAEGDPSRALLHFTEALRLDQDDAGHERVHRLRIAATRAQAPVSEYLGAHEGAVNVVRFSPDETRVASGSDDGTLRIWGLQAGFPNTATCRHPAAVSSLAWSAEGSRILTTCADNQARVWDAGTGRLVAGPFPENEFHFKRPASPCACLSPDGSRVATGWKGTVRVFSTRDNTPVGPSLEHTSRVAQVVFSPDGQRLLAVCDNGTGHVWPMAAGTRGVGELRLDPATPGNWAGGAFSPDGRRVVLACHAGVARVWDVETGLPVSPQVRDDAEIHCQQVGFLAGGEQFFTAGIDHQGSVWNTATGQRYGSPLTSDPGLGLFRPSPSGQACALSSFTGTVRVRRVGDGGLAWPVLHHDGFVFWSEVSRDSRRLAVGTQQGAVQIWRYEPEAALQLMAGRGRVAAAGFSPDGARALTVWENGSAQVWKVLSPATNPLAAATFPATLQAAFAPKGDRVVICGWDGFARLWDTATGQTTGQRMGHPAAVRVAAFSRDGGRLVTITLSSEPGVSSARVWNAGTGEPVTPAIAHPTWLDACEFTPDGQRFLTACADGQVRVFDAAQGTPVFPPLPVGGYVWEAHFSPDGRMLVAASADDSYLARSAVVFDALTGRRVHELAGHRDGVSQALFSPDGRSVATGGEDAAVMLWDVRTGRRTAPPMMHMSKITRVAFSPDSRLLASASWDGTARVWDVATGTPVTPPLRHAAGVRFVTFSPDGRLLLTAGEDGVARVWSLDPAAEEEPALRRAAEALCAASLDASGDLAPRTPAAASPLAPRP